MAESKLWKGIVIGAIAGGILSLLDKETRKVVGENCRNTTCKVTYAVSHPKQIVNTIKDRASDLRITVNEMSEDITYIMRKIEEVRELTPQVASYVKETKDVFMDEGTALNGKRD